MIFQLARDAKLIFTLIWVRGEKHVYTWHPHLDRLSMACLPPLLDFLQWTAPTEMRRECIALSATMTNSWSSESCWQRTTSQLEVRCPLSRVIHDVLILAHVSSWCAFTSRLEHDSSVKLSQLITRERNIVEIKIEWLLFVGPTINCKCSKSIEVCFIPSDKFEKSWPSGKGESHRILGR